MNKQSQSLLSGIEQEQAVAEASKGSALEQIKAAEALLINVTKQAICCSPTPSYTWPTQEHFVVETSGPSGIKRTF